MQAANWGQNLQAGARGAADSFNRFVEGEDGGPQRSRAEPERRDFWDDFSSLASEERVNAGAGHGHGHQRSGSRSDVIGTAAMRKTPGNSSLANTSTPGTAESTAPSGVEGGEAGAASSTTAKGKEDWNENW